ncbi:MAG: hypothetical protein Q8Q29_10510 [Actinomycetota bacterium]|nr:hypothetical protein [Actinomycetota bacterium]
MKWLLFAIAGVVGFTLAIEALVIGMLGIRPPDLVYELTSGTIWMALPVAAGLAIFRHGLYDIDRIISRTVAYAVVVGVLTAAYLGVVVGIGALVGIWDPLTAW